MFKQTTNQVNAVATDFNSDVLPLPLLPIKAVILDVNCVVGAKDCRLGLGIAQYFLD